MNPTKIALSRYECAHLLGISFRLLDKCIEDGRINVVRLGDRVLIPHSELEELTRSKSGPNSKKAQQPARRRGRTLHTARRRQVGR